MVNTEVKRSDRITEAVGNCRANRLGDVLWAKAALACLGRYSAARERHGYIDRELREAIEGYQRDRGLRRDGYMNPGGETECTIWLELARLAGRPTP